MLVALVVALVQIRRAPSLSSTARAIWVLIVLFAPIAGPVIWFLVGRRPQPE
ncbi:MULTISPECIES: PLDc N-terminal domain-containing protein [Cryobacterium]|nr:MULTISPECIES: PLDc N-terminal domain-containing protein [Cryobacterium]